MIDLTKEILIQDINNITGKKLSERDFIYGSNSSLKSIEFVQIISFIEDEYISSDEVDLLHQFSFEDNEMDINDFYNFIKKWI